MGREFEAESNPNNPVVILCSRWSLHPHPAIVPIEGAVLFKLGRKKKIGHLLVSLSQQRFFIHEIKVKS